MTHVVWSSPVRRRSRRLSLPPPSIPDELCFLPVSHEGQMSFGRLAEMYASAYTNIYYAWKEISRW